LVQLRSLQVEGNQLECFPVEIARMERLMSQEGRLFFTTNPLLSPSLVDQQRARPKSMLAFPTLKELSGRALLTSRSPPPQGEARSGGEGEGQAALPMDLERYLDEHARCSVCGRFVWAAFVEEVRYQVIRFRHMPVVYRCCSLHCLGRIDQLLPSPATKIK
jgi:hypothetical protein